MAFGSTVYDRFKKTGYLTGPRHRYEAGMDEAGPPQSNDEDTESDAEGPPPNLRDAGDSPDTCADCVYVNDDDAADLKCSKYGDYPVTANQTCDDFAPKMDEEEGEAPDNEGAEEGSVKPLSAGFPGGLLNQVGARARARGALRRR